MSKIDCMKAIIQILTGYTVIFGNGQDTGVYISPSPMVDSNDYELIDFFDVVVVETSLANLETKEHELLSLKTNVDFNYNDFNAMGYIIVSDGTDFAVSDAIVGTTSGATGTVYRIVDNTVYLRKITGVWQVEDINGKTATCLSAATTIVFPFYITNKKMNKGYTIDEDQTTMGQWFYWIRFEARWTLL